MSIDLTQARRTLALNVEQQIREFELKTQMRVTSFKLKRDEMNNIESVIPKVELPDDE